MRAANDLEVDALFNLCAAFLASKYKYAEWEHVKAEFGLPEATDFKPEEWDELAEKYPYMISDEERKIQERILKLKSEGHILEDD